MAQSKVVIHPTHPYVENLESNTAGVQSRVLQVVTPNNTNLYYGNGIDGAAPGSFFPAVKLYKSDGTEIDRTSVIVFAARAAQDRTKREFASIEYGAFADLTSAEQRSTDYKQAIRAVLGQIVRITEGNAFEVYVDSDDVIDWTQGKTVFEIPAAEDRV